MSAKVTVQQAVQQLGVLKPRIATLVASSTSLQPTDGVEKALKVHADALSVKEGMELFLPSIVNIQRPVSVADGNMALNIIKDLQKSWNIVIDNAIKKKAYFDSLPVGNITALIAQDLKLTYEAMLDLANAFVDAVPAELEGEAKSTKKEFEDSIKKAIAVYQ